MPDISFYANLATILGGLAVVFGVIRWIVKRAVDGAVDYIKHEVVKELKPNSGSSMRDAVDRISAKQDDLSRRLDKLELKK